MLPMMLMPEKQCADVAVKACNAAVGVAIQSDKNEWGGDWSGVVGVCLMAKGWLECKCGLQGSWTFGPLLKPEQSAKSSLDVERRMSE